LDVKSFINKWTNAKMQFEEINVLFVFFKIAYNSCTIYDQMHQHIDSKNVDEMAKALIEVK